MPPAAGTRDTMESSNLSRPAKKPTKGNARKRERKKDTYILSLYFLIFFRSQGDA